MLYDPSPLATRTIWCEQALVRLARHASVRLADRASDSAAAPRRWCSRLLPDGGAIALIGAGPASVLVPQGFLPHGIVSVVPAACLPPCALPGGRPPGAAPFKDYTVSRHAEPPATRLAGRPRIPTNRDGP